MTDDIPRDENGQFVSFDNQNPVWIADDNLVAEYLDNQVTPRVEYVNVDIEVLERAISRAKKHDSMVRIGTINKEWEDEDTEFETGVVFCKPIPSSEKVVAGMGLTREWDKEE